MIDLFDRIFHRVMTALTNWLDPDYWQEEHDDYLASR